MKKTGKLFAATAGIIIILLSLLLFTYLKLLPWLVANNFVIEKIENFAKSSMNLQLDINNPKLKTSLNPQIVFSLDSLLLAQNDTPLAEIKQFEIDLSLKEIFKRKIVLNKLGADYIYANANELSNLSFGNNEKKQKQKEQSNWKFDIFHSLMYIKKTLILYKPQNSDISFKIDAKNLEITDTRNPKYIKFDFIVDLAKGNKTFQFKINDQNRVFFKDRKLQAKDTELYINNSKIVINFIMDEYKKYNLNINSQNFNLNDLTELTKTNLFIPNGDELLAILKDINGNFDFNIDMNNSEISGYATIDEANFKCTIFNDIPITITSGIFNLTGNDIKIKDLKGFYGKNTENILDFGGTIKDYMKTFDTDISGFMIGTKELTTDYLSPMAGYPLELVDNTTAKVIFKMLNGKMDISVIFRLIKGNDILLDKVSVTPVDWERAFRADMQIAGNNFELKNLNYYIAEGFQHNVVVEPLVQVFGNFDIAKNMAIKNIGFKTVRTLPSEFLNLFLGGRIFRKGTISGNLEFLNEDIPYIKGELLMDKVMIPSQRLFLNKVKLDAKQGSFSLDSDGKFRQNDFSFGGELLNELKFPLVIKKMDLSLNDLNIEKIIQSMNRQKEYEANKKAELMEKLVAEEDETAEDTEPSEIVFVKDLIVIKNSNLKIKKGSYKLINFGNVNAHLTLNKDGLLNFKSNDFDIAEGTASTNIVCDLFNQKYNMVLDINKVDSDAISSSILGLPREITGLATGKIELNADKSLKANGKMTFNIQEGTIAKIGLVQYVLNFVSLFRNPLAMISPATIIDLVNIPEGYFDDISGVVILKENNIQGMMIKSSAAQLSTFIIGNYNLEKSDATLRIYTKFSNQKKGVAGALRNISLNALASKVPMSNQNDATYYAEELKQIPPLTIGEKDSQVFLTKIDGDVARFNFVSSLKKIK